MISYSAAQNLIAARPLKVTSEMRPCTSALGAVIAEDIFAPIDLPPFDNSAVDGFAVDSKTLLLHRTLQVIDAIRAIAQEPKALPILKTKKIMTGAPIPQGADAVVMKEDVTLVGDLAHFSREILTRENVRFKGEDLKKGHLVLKTGSIVTPQVVGALLGLGITQVPVFKAPSIKIISTGDELVLPGCELKYGQVYYLVGEMLRAQCLLLGLKDVSIEIVKDDEESILRAISGGLSKDIILLTGGMSKGDYDLVRPALKRLFVEEIFYQGAWRPGKPMYFGKRNETTFFGLPGNPVACFVCFHLFVRPAILSSMSALHAHKAKTATLTNDYEKKAGITHFASAKVNENNQLTINTGQGSHQIFNLSNANALCLIPEEIAIVKAHEVVHYYPI